MDDSGDEERGSEAGDGGDATGPAGAGRASAEGVAAAVKRRALINWNIVESSFDESEFLWARRLFLLHSHRHDLDGVALWAEERLLGALDGVELAGGRCIKSILEPALTSGQPERIACAALIACQLGTPRARAFIARAVDSFVGQELSAIALGLTLANTLDLEPLASVLSSGSPVQQAELLRVFAARRCDPGTVLVELAGSSDARVRAMAIECAVAARSGEASSLAQRGLGDSDPVVVAHAAQAGLVCGQPDAWAVCRSALGSPDVVAAWGRVLPLVAASGAADSLELLGARAEGALRRDALYALGYAGSRAAAELALAHMNGKKAALAHVAAESFATITGLGVEARGFWRAEPDPAAIAFEDDDLGADLGPAPDAALPLANMGEVETWWQAHASRFEGSQRYLDGQPVSVTSLFAYLQNGRGRRRHGIAAELAVRSGGALQLATTAWVHVQRQELAAARGFDPGRVARAPFAGWRVLPTA